MKPNHDRDSVPPSVAFPRLRRMLLIGCTLLLFIGILRITHWREGDPTTPSAVAAGADASMVGGGVRDSRWFARPTGVAPAPSAEEIVAGKLQQFTRSRRQLAREVARRKGVAVPDEVERFFDAMESGDWEEIDRQWKALAKRSRQYEDSTAAHNFSAEAEEAYRLAAQLWPGNPEAVGGLADLLTRGGREADARKIVGEFNRNHPNQRKDLERISAAVRSIGPTPMAEP